MTKSGQTTVPKEIRQALGIEDTSRVYWTYDGERVYITATPIMPLAIESEQDYRERMQAAASSVESSRVRDADIVSRELKTKYGIV